MEIKTKYNIGDVVKLKNGQPEDKTLIVDGISTLTKKVNGKLKSYISYRIKDDYLFIPLLYFNEEELI